MSAIASPTTDDLGVVCGNLDEESRTFRDLLGLGWLALLQIKGLVSNWKLAGGVPIPQLLDDQPDSSIKV